MRPFSAINLLTLLLCFYSLPMLFAQENVLPAPADSLRQEYLEIADKIWLLESFYREVESFPEDPARRLLLERRLDEFTQLKTRIEERLSQPHTADSLGLGVRLASLIPIDSKLRKLNASPALPLEEAYYRTALRHLSAGDEDQAIAAINKSLLAKPDFIPSLSLRCRWQLRHQLPEEALPDVIRLSEGEQEAAQDSLVSLLPTFIKNLESLRREEAHTRLLQLCDGLISAYEFHPPGKAVLNALQEQSRQDMLRAYRNVSRRALASGKRDLALRYAFMARTQSQEWELNTRAEDAALFGSIAAYAARAAEMALKEGQIRHSLEAFYQADSLYKDSLLGQALKTEYQPFLIRTGKRVADSIASSPHPQRFYPLWHHLMEQHPGLLSKPEKPGDIEVQDDKKAISVRPSPPEQLPDYIRRRSKGLSFLIWQGDTSGYVGFLDSLQAFARYRDTSDFLQLVDASAARVKEAFRAWECRKEKKDDHLDAAALRRYTDKGYWVEAAAVVRRKQERRRKQPDCTFPSLPGDSEIKRILDAEKYLIFHEQIRNDILAGRYPLADSLLELSTSFYHRYLEGRQGPPKQDPFTRLSGKKMEGYLLHRCGLAIQDKDFPEALTLMELMRSRQVDPFRTAKLQEELGKQLAEKDLATTHLRNPKTLLAKHIPMVDWYKVLKKAYQKRFR